MDLSEARIAIRERSLLEIFDLALQVARAHALPLVCYSALGMAPLALLNYWLLGNFDRYEEASDYITSLVLLSVFEIPFATSFITLYLGQALFADRPSFKDLASRWWGSLGQLIVFQLVLRALCVPLVVTFLLPLAGWPYLNEIILLERNPLWVARGRGGASTRQRSRVFHRRASGELLVRALAVAFIGLFLIGAWWMIIVYARSLLIGSFAFDKAMYVVALPVAVWATIGYLAVVRFLSYLDLRIRREGWELELDIRHEAAQLKRAF